MIKIVSGHSYPDGSTVALVNLCNQLNSRGHNCVFYGPDSWHLDKCKSGTPHEFRTEDGDAILLHGIELLTIAGLQSLELTISEAAKNQIWRNMWSAVSEILFPASTSKKFMLVLSCREADSSHKAALRYSLFNKIHFVSGMQINFNRVKRQRFICPDFLNALVPSDNKPEKAAGIIGSISKANATKENIEMALEAGMETVILYGFLADPIYFYQNIVPLTKSHPGKIKFAGFNDDQQKMYDSVSDVYASVNRPLSKVPRECALTNTRYHGVEIGQDEFLTNDQIYRIWKNELGLG